MRFLIELVLGILLAAVICVFLVAGWAVVWS